MSTKPASTVQEFPAASVEKIAYEVVVSIPTEEPNDRNRLAYHIWRLLTSKQGTLEHAIAESGARLKMGSAEVLNIIREGLTKQGIVVQ